MSSGLKKDYDVTPIHVDVNIVSNDILDMDKFRAWRPEFNDAEFILEDGRYVCGYAVEMRSKWSKYYKQLFKYLLAVTFHRGKIVDTYHECGYRGRHRRC